MLRSRVGAALFLAAVFVLGPLACEFLRSNGQDCVKDRDCISNHCVQEVCIELGVSGQTDAGADTAEAAPAEETATEAAAETAAEAAAETATDAAADK